MEKINFESLPSTNTPINAENLNKIQDNVEKAIPEIVDNLTTDDATKVLSAKQGKALNEKIEGTVVYENSSGSTGNITLTKSIESVKYIDIEYSAWEAYSTKRLYAPVGKTIIIDGMVMDTENSTKNFSTSYAITNTSLTKGNGAWFNRSYVTGEISGNNTSNKVKIHKVVAYF